MMAYRKCRRRILTCICCLLSGPKLGSRNFTTARRSPFKGRVWVSNSFDGYSNLAFEEWLFKNEDFSTSDGLYFYRNAPAVVIGRHQNPWVECNLSSLLRHRVDLIRRRSGGGTVYHDMGNLNVSVLTARQRHRRRDNLEWIADVLQREWTVPALVSERDDLVVDRFKISGTAARIVKDAAYHHFTLLVSCNKDRMSELLKPSMPNIQSSATTSVRSPVTGMDKYSLDINVEELIQTLLASFREVKPSVSMEVVSTGKVSDNRFPGLAGIQQELRSWQWTFGKTPRFTVPIKDCSLVIDKGTIVDYSCPYLSGSDVQLHIESMVGEPFGVQLANSLYFKIENADVGDKLLIKSSNK